jgi:hypothetical protein
MASLRQELTSQPRWLMSLSHAGRGPYSFLITILRALSRIGFADPEERVGRGGILMTSHHEKNSVL